MSTRIAKDVFDFFNELENNNNRDWFNEHKKEFKRIEADVKGFYNEMMLNLQKHDEVDKMKMFRIYNDVRFSKGKPPYKTHFGASYHRLKPRLRGGYYIHIKPSNTFIATGFWNPEKEDLFRIRKELETDVSELRDIIDADAFKSIWGSMTGEEVKTAPKGFNKEHKDIDLIRKKQYMFMKNFTDEETLSEDFPHQISKAFIAIRPFFDYMSEVLTTDLNGVSLID